MAGYEQHNHNAWVGVQVYPTSRTEVFANLLWNRADATIRDFGYDGGPYTAQLVGLDFPLHSASMAGFSDLDFGQVGLGGGVNVRMTDQLILNALLNYSKVDDKQPYIEDVTGSYFQFFGGVSWVF
ncbi:MAG: hypothetical protein H6Q08_1614 [Acidobacteria bacterium]|jgi:hypothetical protein|nr:hypothetical protein [Acidobacteriota bacterium]